MTFKRQPFKSFRKEYDWSTVINPMTDEEILKWCEALESGVYRQGVGQLRSSQRGIVSFCCLGVKQEINPDIMVTSDTKLYTNHRSDGLGDAPCNLPRRLQTHLMTMNDQNGASFVQIAEFLRKGFGLPPRNT